MKSTKENGRMIITLDGRIDSNNAKAIEDELISMCAPGDDVTLDASELTYISSAGLRVLLRLKKTVGKEVDVINVSNDVYDIFDVTGFVDILQVTKKMRQIDVEGCEVIGEGANGKVFRLDDETIVKVFSPGVSMETVKEERDFARAAFVAGVPTAISYDVAKIGDSYGAVYEMLNAKTLASVISENPESAGEMGRRMGRLMKELHSTPADQDKLRNMLSVYKDRVEQMGAYITEKEMEKLRVVYNALPERGTLVHGDFHPKNIMYMDDELIFIDMGDMGYGHPLLDIGGSYLGMVRIGKINPDIVPKYMGMDYETLLKVWDQMTLEYFGEEKVEAGRRMCELYGEAKYALTPTFYTKATDVMRQQMVDSCRKTGFFKEDFAVEIVQEIIEGI